MTTRRRRRPPAAQTQRARAAPLRQRLRVPWATRCRRRRRSAATDGRRHRAAHRPPPRPPPPRRTGSERPAAVRCGSAPAAPLHVTTDVLDIVINLKGGELDQADLMEYPLRKDTPNIPVRLLSYEPPPTLYLLQSGLIGAAGETAPTHLGDLEIRAKRVSRSRRAPMSCACR